MPPLQHRKWQIRGVNSAIPPWLILVAVASLLPPARVVIAFKYGFEDTQDFRQWQTSEDEQFESAFVETYRKFLPYFPQTDTTLGSSEGHFVYAVYKDGQKNITRRLFHNCQGATGPRCRLNFNAVIRTMFSLTVATRFRCKNCNGAAASNDRRHILLVNSSHSDTGWKKHSLLLGSHPVNFDIEFLTAVPEVDNFVALDDLELVDCEPDILEEICPVDSRNRCHGPHDCLSRDQLCDLHQDCLCGGDELDCESFSSHPEGYLRLDNCDFDSRECLWYNVHLDSAHNSFRWSVVNSTELLHHKEEVSHVPDNYLQISMSQYAPGLEPILRSVVFQPHFSESATCQVRFWYSNTAKDVVLKLELLEISPKSSFPSTVHLWESSFSGGSDDLLTSPDQDTWNRVVRDVNSVPINHSYILQFKIYSTKDNDTSHTGNVSIHSISLSPDCFSAVAFLTSCGAVGDHGPTQDQCDQYYGQEGLVHVTKHGQSEGMQEWTAPESNIYRIQIGGSQGGGEVSDNNIIPETRGTSIIAKFGLLKGEKLYFLVGQPGEYACQAIHEDLDSFLSLVMQKAEGGDGGGGGATIVLKVDGENKTQVLLVAGGGGGLPLDFKTSSRTAPENVPGMSDKEAELFASGPLQGSAPCQDTANKNQICHGKGGFGAGGGACLGGGHGGGANKTQLSARWNLTRASVGQPGRSYVHSSALFHSILRDSHWGQGFVKIFSEIDCGCGGHLCSFPGNNFTTPTCICPDKGIVGSCQGSVKKEKLSANHVFLVVLVGALLITFLSIICMCLYIQRHTIRSRHPTNVKKVASFLCPCIDLSRRTLSLSAHVLPQIQRPPAIMHVNPNYDVVTTKCPEQSLKELPRKHLKLMSALGQGAFGEVYYGLLSNVPMVEGDLPVAVKTLPPMCTEQTEMDFLMEAVIVSKFNHPNIVKFIGVCFDQQPHYLVLELLEGGDLKSFLRQARPKWDQPSSLTVLDLLRLCLDVARGCQHLEEKHFIHRDIAARNCLLTTKGPNRTAKIADFGMARDIYRSDYYKKSGKAMLPVKWMPPEAFLDGVFTSKTDVWSFGILMWEVFSLGHMPYPGCSNEEVMNLVTQGGRLDPPESCPSAVFDIMVSCWGALPEGRPNFSLIIASLERTLQDDDMVSRGLPVFYVPPIINTRGLRLQESQTHNVARPKVSTRGTTSPSNIALIPNISGDGYLEPLLTSGSRSDSQSNFNPLSESKINGRSLREFANGRIFIDSGKPVSKIACRTPRVFYKPGSSHQHSQDAAASESLLCSQNSLRNYSSPQKDEEDTLVDQKYELRVNMNGSHAGKDGHHNDSEDLDNEDLKISQTVVPEHRNKSYTDFPTPPT